MGHIAQAFNFARRSIENPSTDLRDPAQWLVDFVGGGPSDSGMLVSQESATRLTAVWCAVRILSETLASLPLFVYERQEPRGRRRALDHPLNEMLHSQPNDDMSSFFFRELMQAQVVLKGNAYAPIRRDGAGRPRELWPLTTQRVEPKRTTAGGLTYFITLNDGTIEPWAASDMLHIPGLSFDGVKGKSVIGANRDAIGLGLAAQKYGAKLFARGGRVPGVIQTQSARLDPDQRKNIGESWSSSVGGPDNWHKVAVLDRGMEYKEIGIKPDDGQFLETRKFQVIEIARMFKVQPHLLFDLERATFSNIEQQSLEFVIHTMRPWLVRWEQEMNRKLLTREERRRLFVEFNIDGLLRGDSAARGAFYAVGRNWGYLSANDIRDWENLPGIGEQGESYLVPFNMMNAEELVAPAAGGGTTPMRLPSSSTVRQLAARGFRGLKLRRRIKVAQRSVLEDRARMIVKREVGAIEKELQRLLGPDPRNRRNLTTLRQAIDEFYATHADWSAQRMAPIIQNYAELINASVSDEVGNQADEPMPPELERFVREYSEGFGRREASEGRLQLLALTEQGTEQEVAEAIHGRLEEWTEKRPGKIAVAESTQFMSAAAKVVMVTAGVTVLRWVAGPNPCPFCSTLDGNIAGVTKDFVSAGQGVDNAKGEGPPLKPSGNVGHPPLHSNCECDIAPD